MTLTIRHFNQCDFCGGEAQYDVSYGKKRGVIVAGFACAGCSQTLWSTSAFADSDYWLQTRLNVTLPRNAVIEASA